MKRSVIEKNASIKKAKSGILKSTSLGGDISSEEGRRKDTSERTKDDIYQLDVARSKMIQEGLWSCIDTIYNQFGGVYHQTSTYDDMIVNLIPNFISNMSVKVPIKIPTAQSKDANDDEDNVDRLEEIGEIMCKLRGIELDPPKETNEKDNLASNSEKDNYYIMKFGEVYFDNPKTKEIDDEIHKVTPMECNRRGIAYQSHIYVDIIVSGPNKNGVVKETTHKKVYIGAIPVMVKSSLCNLYPFRNDEKKLAQVKECAMDPGGYLVTKGGGRKVMVMQERSFFNMVHVFTNRKKPPKYDYFAEARSMGSMNYRSTVTQIGILPKKKELSVIVPRIPETTAVPLVILFRAFGILKSEDIINMIIPTYIRNKTHSKFNIDLYNKFIDCIVPSLEYAYEIDTQEKALIYIGKCGKKFSGDNINQQAIDYANDILQNHLLPHIEYNKRAHYLSYMTLKLLYMYLKVRIPEDRDHYANKRLQTPGALMFSAFTSAFRQMLREVHRLTERAVKINTEVKMISYIKIHTIENMISAFINNGASNKVGKAGIVQTYEQFNYTGALSNARKMVIPIMTDSIKIIAPRNLHGSHFGVACCLTGDTMILMADSSLMSIKDIVKTLSNPTYPERLSVFTVNMDTFRLEKTFVSNPISFMPKDPYLLKITNSDGNIINCTIDHPFLTSKPHHSSIRKFNSKNFHWVKAYELKVDDILVIYQSMNLFISQIVSIERCEVDMVYDFTTDSDHHNFIANNYVVHNCSETPEGKKTGLVKNMAMLCYVTIGIDHVHIIELVKSYKEFIDIFRSNSEGDIFVETRPKEKEVTPRNKSVNSIDVESVILFNNIWHSVKILVNGMFIGNTQFPKKLINELLFLRRSGNLSFEIGMCYDEKMEEIRISTDSGRLCRPLMIVDKGKIQLIDELLKNPKLLQGKTVIDSLSKGYIEYIDKDEEEMCLVCMSFSDFSKMSPEDRLAYTHCELHPAMMFGIGASLIPYASHNQSPRVTYEAAMSKQSVGTPFTNYKYGTGIGSFKVLDYPQKPLTATRSQIVFGADKLPSGQNMVVMVAQMEGWGQEDAYIMSNSFTDFGGMAITQYYNFHTEIKLNEILCVPTKDLCNNFKGDASLLDTDGIICKGERIKPGTILIGKIVPCDDPMQRKQYRNESIIYQEETDGTVENVEITTNGAGYRSIKVTVAVRMIPEIGDKIASMISQKGTIAMKMRKEDLPFTSEGVTPDIIMNPLAFPSRMTIGQLIEGLSSKVVATSSYLHKVKLTDITGVGVNRINGSTADGTSYQPIDYDAIRRELKEHGYNGNADEVVYSGTTGEKLKVLMCTGLVYYQRLKHLAIFKIHARATGPRNSLTHQPTEGRKQGGGFRIGCMEGTAISSQGAAFFLKDRLIEQSDEYEMWVCKTCGLQASVNKSLGIKECKVCVSSNVVLIKIPYATKLLQQELLGCGVVTRIMTTPFTNEVKVEVVPGKRG